MRVAIVTFFFPPGDEIGGMRPFALATNLAKLGHEVLVVTHQPSPAEEGFRVLVVGKSARRSGAPLAQAPKRHDRGTLVRSLLQLFRKVLAVPDGKTLWAVRARRSLRREMRRKTIDLVVTTGPPHSVHLAGMWGFDRTRQESPRWIVDMRDLWTDNPYYDYGAGRKALDRLIEARVLRRADAITAASEGFARALTARHGVAATCILTGYDDSARVPAAARKLDPHAPLRIVHAGNLYLGRRDPSIMFEAARDMVAEGKTQASSLVFTFIGAETGPAKEAADRLGVAEMVEVLPPVPHRTVLTYLDDADALLLVMWRSELTASEVPGKLFEYLAFRKPIVALGARPDGEVADMVRETGCGWVVDSVAECRSALESLLDGQRPEPAEASLTRYSQTRMAAEFLRVAAQSDETTP